jgi:hypothetical protein
VVLERRDRHRDAHEEHPGREVNDDRRPRSGKRLAGSVPQPETLRLRAHGGGKRRGRFGGGRDLGDGWSADGEKLAGAARLVLTFPVLEHVAESTKEEPLAGRAAGAHLVAVGVLDDFGRDQRGEH